MEKKDKQLVQLDIIATASNNFTAADTLTASQLSAFIGGDSAVTIGAENLFDFFEKLKRLKALADECLKAVEMYAATKPTDHFTFSKAAESVAITDQEEALRILREDLGMSEADVISVCKLDANALADKLGYNKKGLVAALPGAAEIKLAKSRMLVK